MRMQQQLTATQQQLQFQPATQSPRPAAPFHATPPRPASLPVQQQFATLQKQVLQPSPVFVSAPGFPPGRPMSAQVVTILPQNHSATLLSHRPTAVTVVSSQSSPAVSRIPAPSAAHATLPGQPAVTPQRTSDLMEAHEKFKAFWTQIRKESGQSGHEAAVDDLFTRAATHSISGAEFLERVQGLCSRNFPPDLVSKLDKLFVS